MFAIIVMGLFIAVGIFLMIKGKKEDSSENYKALFTFVIGFILLVIGMIGEAIIFW